MISSWMLGAAASLSLPFAAFAQPAASSSSSSSATGSSSAVSPRITINHAATNVLPLPFARGANDPYVPTSASFVGSSNVPSSVNLSTTAHFQIYLPGIADKIFTPQAKITTIVEQEGYAFAHEATTYFPQSDSLFFCSNAGGANGRSNITTNNVNFVITNLTEVAARAAKGANQTSFDKDVHALPIDDPNVQMTNGGTPYGPDYWLLVSQGRGDQMPGSLSLIPRTAAEQSTKDSNATVKPHVLINNAYGKQFNSPNDASIHPVTGQIAFTDSQYGITQYFRPPGVMPLQTWIFDAQSGYLKLLDDTVDVPNGVVITQDGKTMYICDSAPVGYDRNATRSATIKAFDMQTYNLPAAKGQKAQVTRSLTNRRIFAWPSTGFCDGIKLDNQGNVYTGTQDGVEIFSPQGDSVAKIFLPGNGGVQLAFAGKGRLAVTSEERIFLVEGLGIDAPELTALPPKDKRIQL